MPVDKQKQYERQAKWDQANTIRFLVKFVKTTEADLIEHLNQQPNKSGYIKSLIRADIQREKETSK